MNDLFPDIRAIALWAIGALVAVIGWFLRRHLDDYEAFKKNAASRSEMERMHQENGDKLDAIEETVSHTHKRIDDLFKFLAGR